ncbi:MAG: hypothetical protein IPM18_04275 [Phycisphaerales bacterium]|nr:hypothetical protein [Phycisphaerales bacterium]
MSPRYDEDGWEDEGLDDEGPSEDDLRAAATADAVEGHDEEEPCPHCGRPFLAEVDLCPACGTWRTATIRRKTPLWLWWVGILLASWWIAWVVFRGPRSCG